MAPVPRRRRDAPKPHHNTLSIGVIGRNLNQQRNKDDPPLIDRRHLPLPGAPTHGRPHPYRPSPQVGGKYPSRRGNPPPGIEEKQWDNAFNAASDRYYHNALNQGYHKGVANHAQAIARDNGKARDKAVEKLIVKGFLPKGFVDSNP